MMEAFMLRDPVDGWKCCGTHVGCKRNVQVKTQFTVILPLTAVPSVTKIDSVEYCSHDSVK